MAEKTKCLPTLLRKTLGQDIRANLVRYCPTMDLIAVAFRDERIEVLRLSGQRAFSVQRKGKDVQVVSLCWKYNGQYLAVSWSDGVVDVVSSETGNALQNFRHVTAFRSAASARQDESIECLGWGMSLLDNHAGRSRVSSMTANTHKSQSRTKSVNLDDFLEREPNLDLLDMPSYLPEQLSAFDATDLMPKLPILPVLPASAYKSGQQPLSEMFALQPLLDDVLHKGPSKELNALNSFLMSDSKGVIRLIVYDSLSIGNITTPGLSLTTTIRHLKHHSHPFAHCHVLLSRIQIAPGQACMALVPISLRLLSNAGRNIHFIDYKTAQLDILVQYISETILAIVYQWKHCQELPSRFQASIEEDLAERREPGLAQSLYQLAAAGFCTEKLSEWLKDELAERGHKRWDQAVGQGYVKVIEMLQENLLPALDRCNAVLTSLQGLAQYYEHSPAFDVPIATFSSIQDIIRCMRLLGHQMLFFASEEQRRFASFSRWLRLQIDIQASDPSSAAGQELLERDNGVNYTLVLSYIQHTLKSSRLEQFLCHPFDAPSIHASAEMYEILRQALEGYKSDKPFKQDLLKLPAYHREWCRHNTTLIEQITSWQRANVLMPGALMLSNADSSINAIRTVSDESLNAHALWTYSALVNKQQTSSLAIFRITHSDTFDDVPKSVAGCDVANFDVGDAEILDLQFEDDVHLLLLVSFSNCVKLLSLRLARTSTDRPSVTFEPTSITPAQMRWPNGRSPQMTDRSPLPDSVISSWTLHTFPNDGSFLPRSFEVNGRQERRAAVLIGQDKRQMLVLGLEAATANGKDETSRSWERET